MRAEIDRAADSHGGLVLVVGEAGIGKTTLLTGAADDARRRDALVLSGSCWDSDNAPGYWPWVQVVRALRRSLSAEEWEEAAARGGAVLSTLLGESSNTEPPDEFELYDTVTSLLVSASHIRPVAVVLDDLHWADPASIKLLEFAVQHTWFERVLLIGAYRDVEVATEEHPLRQLLAPLTAKATTLTLSGLRADEVGELMTRTVGQAPDSHLAAEVHRRTGGNPFFVEQTARLWHSGATVSATAPEVGEAVRRRLSLLPESVARLLTTASTLGRRFHRQVLAAVAAEPVPQTDRLLDQAATARLVVPLGSGEFSFAHDLLREALYDSLDEAERRRLHAAVARRAADSPHVRERLLPAELAAHAYLAGDALDSERAVDMLTAAAHDASDRLAVDEAIRHRHRALERLGDAAPRRRAMLLLDLGFELLHTKKRVEGWESIDASIALVRELDDPALLTRVAISVRGAGRPGDRAQLKADLLNEAYRAFAGGKPTDRHSSLDRLVQDLSIRLAVSARRGGDDEALAFGLMARHNSMWGPGTAAERVAVTEEILTVARRAGNHDAECFASALRWVALLEVGDPGFHDQLTEFVGVAERHSQRRFLLGTFVDRAIVDTHMGRFDEAAAHLDRLRDDFEHEHDGFEFLHKHPRWALLLARGRFDEIDTLLDETFPGHPHTRLLKAVTAIHRGDVDAARRLYRVLAADPEARYGGVASLWLRLEAQLGAATKDARLCERVHAQLAPHADEWGISLWGCDVSGPQSLWIAWADAGLGRWDDAVRGFTAAWRSADRMRLRAWSIEARAGLAEALPARDASKAAATAVGGRGSDLDGAALLDEVEEEADEIGMPHVAERMRRIRAEVASGRAESEGDEFRRQGAVWSLRFDGRSVHMPDAKGLRDLHVLLGSPGVDVPAVRLLDPAGGEVVVAARRLGGDAVLDEEAKARYRARLERLDEEIDRAAARGDDGRAAEFDAERQALLDQLRAAAGLGGRDRRLGDEAERARKTVTARIRDTLRKLDGLHPALAAH
ncbi:MAG: ATP-binding protein, partial [Stackebrandtia sp.]